MNVIGADQGVFISDSKYVVRGFAHIMRGSFPDTHRDLWNEFKAALGPEQLAVWKVESHQSAIEAINSGTPLISFIGNVVADRVAELAVEKLQLPYGDVASVEWGESIAARIRARGVSTFIDAVSKDPRVPPNDREARASKRRSQLHIALERSQHQAIHFGNRGRYRCKVCLGQVSRRDILQWLRSPCEVERVHLPTGDGFSNLLGCVRVGRSEVHSSHTLLFDPSTACYFCATCGKHAREILRGLSAPCSRVMTQAGKDAIRRICRGKRPGASASTRLFNACL